MNLKKERIYDFLDEFIESKLLSTDAVISEALEKDMLVDISGVDFKLNCWEEIVDVGYVVCVELSRKKMLFLSESYSLGVLFLDDERKKLKQEELWGLGF